MAKTIKIKGEDYITYSLHYSKSGADADAKKLKDLGYKVSVRLIDYKSFYEKAIRTEKMYAVYRSKAK
jgi:hypothetical protein